MSRTNSPPPVPDSAATALGKSVPLAPAVAPELLADWAWTFDERERGAFKSFAGQHIAILGQQVIGSGQDPLALRYELAASHHVPPERLVVIYVESLNDLLGG